MTTKGTKFYAIGYDDLMDFRGIIYELYQTKQEALDAIELFKDDDYDDEHWHYFVEEFTVA